MAREAPDPSDPFRDQLLKMASSKKNRALLRDKLLYKRVLRDRNSKKTPIVESKTPKIVERSEKPRTFYAVNAKYKQLREKCHKRWKMGQFKKRAEDDQDDTVVDYSIEIQVATRSSEGAAKWDRIAQATGTTTKCAIDYVVGTTIRKLGDDITVKVLVKWNGFPVPSWVHKAGIQGEKAIEKELTNRLADLDFIELELRRIYGDVKFEILFPNRYLKDEIGMGLGGFIINKRGRYTNELRSIENRINVINERAGLPPIYIEDWTNERGDAKALRDLKFINYLVKSKIVKSLLQKGKEMKKTKCTSHCRSCSLYQKNGKGCCRMKGHTENVNFECSDDCGCGEKCGNRRMQNGRQVTLCIFREPGKGWGIRIMCEMESFTYVSEYTGEVRDREHPVKDNYDFGLRFEVENKKDKKLVMSAGDMGNETRFFNHSCNPNMQTLTVMIERYGLFYHHFGFLTTRNIRAGEELTFDYFAGQKDANTKRFFPSCRCNSRKCRFKDIKNNKKAVKDDKDDSSVVNSSAPSRRGRGPSNVKKEKEDNGRVKSETMQRKRKATSTAGRVRVDDKNLDQSYDSDAESIVSRFSRKRKDSTRSNGVLPQPTHLMTTRSASRRLSMSRERTPKKEKEEKPRETILSGREKRTVKKTVYSY